MRLAAVVTCKSRLAHLKETAPGVIRALTPRKGGYVLVDWGCPEGSGAWLAQTFPQPNVQVLRVEERGFWKTRAQNMGASVAIKAGVPYLLFADADTILEPPFFDWLIPNLRPDTFFFIEPKKKTVDISGVIAVPSAAFQAAGGFDESFQKYGHEDLELRLRLWRKLGLGFRTFPGEFVGTTIRGIPHTDAMRVQHYGEKDIQKSVADTLSQLGQAYSRYSPRQLHQDFHGQDGPIVKFLMGADAS
jgi:GT2 family glycosyltransferase